MLYLLNKKHGQVFVPRNVDDLTGRTNLIPNWVRIGIPYVKSQMKIDQLTYLAHDNHQIEIIPMPADHPHYAALRCADCGGGLHLKWLSHDECVVLQVPITNKTYKSQKSTATKWAQATHKQQSFYKSYQPQSFALPRAPSILLGDRLTIGPKYTGNSIHTIPIPYLENLLKKNKVPNHKDQKLITESIQRRSGS